LKTHCHYIGLFVLLFCLQIVLIKKTAFAQQNDVAFFKFPHNSVATFASNDYKKALIDVNSNFSSNSLVSFSGTFKDNKVLLSWTLAQDNQLDKIVIERHNGDGVQKPIAEFWLLKDTEVDLINFLYKDNKNLKGKANYRLKLISEDERVEFSNWIQVKSLKN
jgi:hypothetical protein